ncbi:hypothetical protein [Micromonospora sp. NBC_01813]|uniref:hypothetical protein n=1 Tax=Micromonospora sp. NBC_01813 TaxID=2975988 RepID=UPI002DDBB4C7|nr:hypothetical protein [Micromonospora sp. NBC_01813]WSA09751.1 hypothetical protein OG958_02740 [Micromonospora sp. NBC_01813]
MRYGRKQRKGQQHAETYGQQFRRELSKESLGKLAELGGAAVGMLLGLASTKAGLPVPPSTAATGGAIAGAMLGVLGKSAVGTAVDRLMSRKAEVGRQAQSGGKPPTAIPGTGEPKRVLRAIDPARREPRRAPPHRPRRLTQPRADSEAVAAGGYIGRLRQILEEIETQQAKLANVANAMRASQLSLAQLLAGGRQDRTQEIYTWAELSRSNIEEAAVLTHQATKSLKGYMSNL